MVFSIPPVRIILQVLKTALAGGLAWLVAANLLHGPFPYFAPLAAVLTVSVTIAESMKKAGQRFIGTVAGVLVSVVASLWFQVGAFSLFLVIASGMASGALLRLSPFINSQIAVSAVMVLALGHNQGYAYGRILETVIGSVIAIVINAVVIPPNAVPKAEKRLQKLSEHAADVLENLATALVSRRVSENDLLTDVSKLAKETKTSLEAIALADESLRFNPFLSGKRGRLQYLSEGMERLKHISVQIRGIRRGLIDLRHTLPPEASPDRLQQALIATGLCVREFGKFLVHSESEGFTLQQVAADARSAQEDCLSMLRNLEPISLVRDIGAILTDLNRILNEISSESNSDPDPTDDLAA